MNYLVTFEGKGCPNPDELEAVIKAAMAAITQYKVVDIKVQQLYTK